MRLLPVLLIGASALILSACDDHKPRKAPAPKAASAASGASADCCCKDICPNPPKAAPVVGTLEEEGVVTRRDGGHVRRASHERRRGYRHRGRTGTEGVGYLDDDSYGYRRVRSGTEGVGYLDEDSAYRGGYRRVGTSVSVEERETYSESARYSESESGYRYATGGGYVAYGSEGRDGYGGHRRHDRRGGGGYAGVDRDGYLTWPGKTE